MTVSQSVRRNILLTGATGFLGSHFLRDQLRSGNGAICLVRAVDAPSAHARIRQALSTACASYGEAFSDQHMSRCLALPADLGIDGLGIDLATAGEEQFAAADEFWHFASALDYEQKSWDKIFQTNVGGVERAINLALAVGCKKFIYISTAYSAGKRGGSVQEELHDYSAPFNNLYEKSKCVAEHVVRRLCEANELSYLILRPTIVVGVSNTKRSGGSSSGLYGFIREIKRFRRVVVRERNPISVNAKINSRINFIPVDKVIEDINFIIGNKFEKPGIYHLCSDSKVSVGFCLSRISDELGIENIRYQEDSMSERSRVEKMIDKRINFYDSYINQEISFERSLPKRHSVAEADIANFISSFINQG